MAQKWLNPKNVPTNTKNIYDQFLWFILLIQYIPLILRLNHFKSKQKNVRIWIVPITNDDHCTWYLFLDPNTNLQTAGILKIMAWCKKKIRSTNRIVTSWANHKNLQPSRKLTQVPNFDGIDHEKWGLSIVKLVYRRNVQVNLFLTKKNMSTIFFLYPSLVIRTPLAPAEWSLCFSVEKQLEKKTSRSSFQTKKERDERPFFGCKSKMVLSVDRILSVNRSNKRYSPIRFYLQRASFSNIKYRCILLKLVQSCLEKVFGKRLPFEKTTFSHGLLLISNLCRSCDS